MSLTTDPIIVPIFRENPFERADLTFYEVDHSGPSFEARVFLNRPDASEATPTTQDEGYVGSFYIFGHGGCFGDVGHCDVPRQRVSPFDRRGEHQLTPRTKIVIITEHLNRLQAQAEGDLSLTVTVVPVVEESPLASPENAADVLKFDRVRLITYD